MPSLPAGARHRIATDFNGQYICEWRDDNGTYHALQGPNVWTHYGSILDFPNAPKGSPGLHAYDVRPVDHFSIRIENASTLVPFTGGDGQTVTPLNPWGFMSPTTIGELLLPSVPEVVWGELSLAAFNAFNDQFPATMSLGNFVLELKDLAGLIPRLEDSVAKTLASGYLNKKFNYEPLEKDLTALINLVPAIKARLDYLRRTWGVPHRLTWFKPSIIPESDPIKDWDQGWGGHGVVFVKVSEANTFKANCHLLQRLDHLNDFYGLLRAFMGTTGLNNPLKIVWNALPYSFVLDWMRSVSSHLDRFRVQGATGEWSLKGLTTSISLSSTWNAYQVPRTTRSYTKLVGVVHVSRYLRLTELPLDASALPAINALTPTQLALMLAMGTSHSA